MGNLWPFMVWIWSKCGAMFCADINLVHIWFLSFLWKSVQENLDQKWCVFGELLVRCGPHLVQISYSYTCDSDHGWTKSSPLWGGSCLCTVLGEFSFGEICIRRDCIRRVFIRRDIFGEFSFGEFFSASSPFPNKMHPQTGTNNVPLISHANAEFRRVLRQDDELPMQSCVVSQVPSAWHVIVWDMAEDDATK